MLRNLSTSKIAPRGRRASGGTAPARQAVLELDRQHGEQHYGPREQPEAPRLATRSTPALEHALQRRGAEPVAEDDPAGIQHVESDLAGLALEEGRQLEYIDAGEPAFEQLVHREPATAVVHRDDDLVDVVVDRAPVQVRRPDRHAVRRERDVVAFRRARTHEAKPTRSAAPTQLEQARGALAGAVDEHAALEQVLVDDALEQQPRDQRARDRR